MFGNHHMTYGGQEFWVVTVKKHFAFFAFYLVFDNLNGKSYISKSYISKICKELL